MEKIFVRNPRERRALSGTHIAFVGTGSVGSTIADMATRTGVGKLTLIDPEVLAPENLCRHVLTSTSLGKPKVAALAEHLRAVNPEIDVVPIHGTFQGAFPEKPDLIVSAADSFSCESHVNTYALDEGVKTVFVG